MILINDDNWQSVVQESENQGFAAGALPRESSVGGLACAAVFAEHIPLIAESEWKPRIAEMTADGTFIGQRWVSDANADYQNGTPLCWAYSLAESVMATRHVMGQPRIQLAAESVLGVCNYRIQGFYLDKAIAWASEHGMSERQYVPKYKGNPRDWKQGWEDNALLYMPTEWWDLGGKNVWAETVTALLSGWGCYVGYDWWGHAVWLDMLAVNDKGQIAVHTPNSHGPGNDAWLVGSKAIPSMGSFVPRVITLAA